MTSTDPQEDGGDSEENIFEFIQRVENDDEWQDKLPQIISFCQRVKLEKSDFFNTTFDSDEAVKLITEIFDLGSVKQAVNLGNRLIELGLFVDIWNIGEFQSKGTYYGLQYLLTEKVHKVYLTFKGVREVRKKLKKSIKNSYMNMKEIIINDVLLLLLDRLMNYERVINDMEEEYDKLYRKYLTGASVNVQEQVVSKNLEIERLKKRVRYLEHKLREGGNLDDEKWEDEMSKGGMLNQSMRPSSADSEERNNLKRFRRRSKSHPPPKKIENRQRPTGKSEVNFESLRKRIEYIEAKRPKDAPGNVPVNNFIGIRITEGFFELLVPWIFDGTTLCRLLQLNKQTRNFLLKIPNEKMEHIVYKVMNPSNLPMLQSAEGPASHSKVGQGRGQGPGRVVLVSRVIVRGGREENKKKEVKTFPRVLNLQIVNQVIIKDEHFRMFPAVRVLYLDRMSTKFKGEGLLHCPNLRELTLDNSDHLNDRKMLEHCRTVEVLRIRNCAGITGGGFSHLRGSLKELEIEQSFKVNNRGLTSLPNVERVKLINCYAVTGRGLSVMPGLKHVHIEKCSRIKPKDMEKLSMKGISIIHRN